MKIVKPSVELMFPDKDIALRMLKNIEYAGRNCYQTQDKITDTSYDKFIKMIISKGHESVLEHSLLTFDIITDRGIMAELTRHRHASFSIKSTRYCVEKGEIDFIVPSELLPNSYQTWQNSIRTVEINYFLLSADGNPPEVCRSALPSCTATQIVMSCNFREMRHILKLRKSKAAHPDMRLLMQDVQSKLNEFLLTVFEGI
jgi:thymidylate synthase (FAD)